MTDVEKLYLLWKYKNRVKLTRSVRFKVIIFDYSNEIFKLRNTYLSRHLYISPDEKTLYVDFLCDFQYLAIEGEVFEYVTT